jgi:HSP20 family protein
MAARSNIARFNIEGPDPRVAGWRRLCVRQTRSSLRFTLDVPGLDERDIGVVIHDGVLHIRGEPRCDSEAEAELVRASGLKVAKSFSLPCEVDLEAATAAVKDGVLTITLPKALTDRAPGSAERSRLR